MEDIAELLCMMGIAVCGIPLFFLYVVPIILPYILFGIIVLAIIILLYTKMTAYIGPITWVLTACLLCDINISSISQNHVLLVALIILEAIFIISTCFKYSLYAIIYMTSTIISLFISAFMMEIFAIFLPIEKAHIGFIVSFIIVSIFVIGFFSIMCDNKLLTVQKGKWANIAGVILAFIVFFFANMPILNEVFFYFVKKYNEMGLIECLSYIIPISIVFSAIETFLITLPSLYSGYRVHKS